MAHATAAPRQGLFTGATAAVRRRTAPSGSRCARNGPTMAPQSRSAGPEGSAVTPPRVREAEVPGVAGEAHDRVAR